VAHDRVEIISTNLIRTVYDNIYESNNNKITIMNFTLQNHKSISFLIEFYLQNTKDLDNENLNNLIITNASLGSKLENK